MTAFEDVEVGSLENFDGGSTGMYDDRVIRRIEKNF